MKLGGVNLLFGKSYTFKFLKFPLLDEAKSKPISYYARSKFLTGESRFTLPNNKCNSVDLDVDNILYTLNVPYYSFIDNTLRYLSVTEDFFEYTKISRVSGSLYKLVIKKLIDMDLIEDTLYLIVKNKTILCVFMILSEPYKYQISYIETSNYYECVLTHRGTKHTIKISKEDLTFEVIR